MDHSPPPLFRQGPSALARLVVCVMLALGLLVTDAHFHALTLFRQVISTGLYPLQRAALVPRDAISKTLSFFVTGDSLRAQVAALQTKNLQLGLAASRGAELQAENEHLRALLALSQRAPVTPVPAEVQYDTRSPFDQKVVIDHGMQSHIENGAPVITEDGLVGQITRVFPFQSEVTLLTDRDQAVPVQIVRTGVRSVVYGTANGDLLDLRFVPASADVQVGDELVTSGLDGIYPSGLPVARVSRVDKQSDTAFAKVLAVPIAHIRGIRQLLVLHYHDNLPPNPIDVEAAQAAASKGAKGKNSKAAATGASSAAAAGANAMSGTAATGASAAAAASGASAPLGDVREATAAALARSEPASAASGASAPAAGHETHDGRPAGSGRQSHHRR